MINFSQFKSVIIRLGFKSIIVKDQKRKRNGKRSTDGGLNRKLNPPKKRLKK